MITYEDALKIAKEREPEIDNASEYENGFVFGCSKCGVSSFVVLLAVPGMIIYKVYRKIRYGCKLTD